MGLSEFDPAAHERVSWNSDRKVGAKRALKPRQIGRPFLPRLASTKFEVSADQAADLVNANEGELSAIGAVCCERHPLSRSADEIDAPRSAPRRCCARRR